VVRTPVAPGRIIAEALQNGIFAGIDLGCFRPEWRNLLLIAVTEKRSRQEMDDFVKFLSKYAQ